MPDAPRSYEETWSELVPRLRAALRAKGLGNGALDDVLQETAVRLWERWERLDTTADLFPLALTIARNLSIDRARELKRVDLRADVDAAVGLDPAETAQVRIELQRVLEALRSLNPRYRALLLSDAGWGAATTEHGNTANVARMRARKRLRVLLDRAGVFVFLPLHRLRSRFLRSDGAARTSPDLLLRVAEVAVMCLLTVSIQHAGGVQSIDDAGRGAELARIVKVDPSTAQRTDHTTISGAHGTGTSFDRSSGRAGETGGPGSTQTIRLPRAKGRADSRGSFGHWGADEQMDGSTTILGEDAEWEYKYSFRNPRCVRRAAEGEVSTDCSGARAPSGHVEAKYAGKGTRVDF